MVSEPMQVDVALMYQDNPMPAAMRSALAGLGVSIAYEAAASAFDLAALKAAGARSVVVSMDSNNDAAFETIDQLLADGYSLVFNETDVSEALLGHDQARWARHLAAKLHCDPSVELPLRPLDAVAPASPSLTPEPASAAPSAPEPIVEAAALSSAPIEEVVVTQETASQRHHELPSEHDEHSAEVVHVQDTAPAFAEVHELQAFAKDDIAEAHDAHELDFEAAPLDSDFQAEDTDWATFQPSDINIETTHMPQHDLSEETLDPIILSRDEDESADVHVNLQRQDKAAALSFADGDETYIAADGAETHALPEADGSVAPLQKSSDWFQGKNEETLHTEGTATRVADDWALLDFETPGDMPTPLRANTTTAPAVTVEAPAAHSSFADWSLAPMAIEDASLSGGDIKYAIPRVWVLFGSIGTPEALREFLGGLPEKLAALLIVVAPIGADFQSALIAQLTKASALPIRVPEHGTTTMAGEVLLLPPQGRLQVKPDGRVLLTAEDKDGLSIPEALMRDLIESFEKRAGIILLSGTVSGAIAATQLVSESGGSIWAQHSDTCVISSMVDSANDAGLIHYSAPPRQLAARLAAICATAE